MMKNEQDIKELQVLTSSTESQLKDLQGIPNNKALQAALLSQLLENSAEDLAETLEDLQSEKEKSLKIIKSLEDIKKEELTLAMVCFPEGDSPQKTKDFNVSYSDDMEIKELKQKVYNMKRLRELRVTQLKEFLQTNFPEMDEYIESEENEDDTEFNERRKKKVMLADILQTLINTSMKNPNEPWINIDSSMWAPHIQLLLRTRIAVRNSENPNLIKLEKFDE